MTANGARFDALAGAIGYKPSPTIINFKEPSAEALFGANVFGLAQMKAHLPKEVFRSLKRTIDGGHPLDPKIADVVPPAINSWALPKGPTPYAPESYPPT